MRLRSLLLSLFIMMGLSGCSVIDWMVYKIDIPQGNYVDTKEVDKLRIRMTKDQVRYVLGPPMLIDAFDKDVWYYIYSYQEGSGDYLRKDLIAKFHNNRLIRIEGDYKPNANFSQPLDM